MLSIADDEHSGTTESHRLPWPGEGYLIVGYGLLALLLSFPCFLHFLVFLLCHTDCRLLISHHRDFGNGRSAFRSLGQRKNELEG